MISNIYELFFHETSNEFTDQHMEALFNEHRQQELYRALQTIYSIPGTTVSPEKLSEFTSSKDILYLLNGCHDILGRVKEDSTSKTIKRVITAKQLHLLLQFFIQYSIVLWQQKQSHECAGSLLDGTHLRPVRLDHAERPQPTRR